jgi:hypothetical protein
MLLLDHYKLLKKLKVITIMGISPGCSITPTKVMGTFFKCEFESIELLLPNLFPGAHAKERSEMVSKVDTLEEQIEIRTGRTWRDIVQEVDSHSQGMILKPMGFNNVDHNLISRMDGHLVYKEYPYWYHRGESFRTQPTRYKYMKLQKRIEVELEVFADFKWKVFRDCYPDVQGQFNPRLGSARPYFANIHEEMFFRERGISKYENKHELVDYDGITELPAPIVY